MAERLLISERSTFRIIREYKATGQLPIQLPKRGRARIASMAISDLLSNLVEGHNSIYLCELMDKLYQDHAIKLSLSTVHRMLIRSDYTLNILDKNALEQNETKRMLFKAKIHSEYLPYQIVNIDEMGKNDLSDNRKRGYSLKGKKTSEKIKIVRGDKLSLIGALTVDGMIKCRIVMALSTMQLSGPLYLMIYYLSWILTLEKIALCCLTIAESIIHLI